MATPAPGLYLAHKPRGPTSSEITRAFGEGKVSHAGTLDPFAEGLLLLLAGPATRLIDLFHEAPKKYVAEIAWGVETDTGDLLGREQSRSDATTLTPEQLSDALSPFIGWTEQVPPATSAKKIGGEPAYQKAHRGERVELNPSRVFLHSARFTGHSLPDRSTLELVCRGGFYVRSLARDLGRALGCGAHLSALRRPSIGPWSDPGSSAIPGKVAAAAILPWLPRCELTDAQMGEVKRDRPIEIEARASEWPFPAEFPPPRKAVRAYHLGKLVTILEPAGDDRWKTRYALGRGL